MIRQALAAMGLVAALASSPPALAASPFSNWAAVIVSGDNHAGHADASTEAFDNARRDIGRTLAGRGFSPANIAEFSVEAARHFDTKPGPATIGAISAGLRRLTAHATGGCLFYLTSHGSPDGAVLGDKLAAPSSIAKIIDRSCGARPTVAVISACFSGVFVPALAGPDRLILTAARRDRSSFGCGEADIYPYFDGCVLEALPTAPDFLALAARARACVKKRERQEGMAPASEPQVSVGAGFRAPPFALNPRQPERRTP